MFPEGNLLKLIKINIINVSFLSWNNYAITLKIDYIYENIKISYGYFKTQTAF